MASDCCAPGSRMTSTRGRRASATTCRIPVASQCGSGLWCLAALASRTAKPRTGRRRPSGAPPRTRQQPGGRRRYPRGPQSLRSVSACALSMTKCTASGLSRGAPKPVGCGPAVTAAVTVNTGGRQLSRAGHRDARSGGISPGVRRIPPSLPPASWRTGAGRPVRQERSSMMSRS